MSKQSDALAKEARAMRRVEAALSELTSTARARVIRWVHEEYGDGHTAPKVADPVSDA